MSIKLSAVLVAATAMSVVLPAAAEITAAVADGSASILSADTLIVTGTRRSDRTAIESATPIDIIGGEALQSTVSEELADELQMLVPSFNVQRLPAADGLAFVRPATLRGLSPDQTLVLVNGKRQHRSALLGTRGAQGVDLAQIPTFSIGRVEVLRDGAAAQYGSDAIAGVINIILDKTPGFSAFGMASQYYEGDGELYRTGAKAGFELPRDGFVVAGFEYANANATSRSIQRPDAISFQQENPHIDLPNPVQRWGQPDREIWRVTLNGEMGLSDTVNAYLFGIYGEGDQTTDFNWRRPGESSYRMTAAYPGFDLRRLYPAGFTPRFGQKDQDITSVGGLKGEFSNGLSWDLSAGFGRNEINYYMRESINASFGPDSPTSFDDGSLIQQEFNLNADFVLPVEIEGLSEPMSIAFGAERRHEKFKIKAGDFYSYAVGPAAQYGVPSGSSGFPGYSPEQEGSWGRTSHAGYLDLEISPTEKLTLGAAGRLEDYADFGTNFSWKLSGRYEVMEGFALRGTLSTGFRAPTPGQSNYTRTSQGLDTNTLQVFTSGLLSVNNPIAQTLGAVALKPEKSKNVSVGVTLQPWDNFSLTMDYYNVSIDDRFGQSQGYRLTPDQRDMLIAQGVPGAESVTSVRYYTNAFNTRTQGVDIVASYLWPLAGDQSVRFTAAYNYNDTKVLDHTDAVSSLEVFNIEDRLPQQTVSAGAEYRNGAFSTNLRARWFDKWTDAQFQDSANLIQNFGSEVLVDLSVSYEVNRNFTVTVGAENLFDNYPDKATFQASRGLVYSRNAPYDTDGGLYYIRVGVKY